jgi:hypothetical protein
MTDMTATIAMLKQQMDNEDKTAKSNRRIATDKRKLASECTAEAEQMEDAARMIKAKCGEKPSRDGTRTGPVYLCESGAKAKRAAANSAAAEADVAAKTAEAHEARVAEYTAAIEAIGGKVERE